MNENDLSFSDVNYNAPLRLAAENNNLSIINFLLSQPEINLTCISFQECRKLTEINLISQMISIPMLYFYGCISLTNVTIPSSVKEIEEFAFFGCSSLKSIKIPPSLTIINNFAFYGCSSLCEISFSNPCELNNIGHSAFKGCSSLIEIEIPSSVETIGDCCFELCSKLQKIKLSNVKRIGIQTFRCCSMLKEIKIPESVTKICSNSFDCCSSLEKFEIPSSVNKIGESVFKHCISLKEINIPESITKLKDETFYDCSSLSKINIQKPFEKIGSRVFDGCFLLQGNNVIGNYVIQKASQLIEIPKSSIIDCIDTNNYHKKSLIDTGGIGHIYLYTNKITKKEFAVKINRHYFQTNEINIRLTADHPTIAKFVGFSFHKDIDYEPELSFFMEKYNRNCRQFDNFDNTSKQIILIGFAYGMKYLHKLNIFHRNLSLYNILIDENNFPHITGFSLSCFSYNSDDLICGTLMYKAPEIGKSKASKESDVYSFGIIMYQIITGQLPFDRNNRHFLMNKKLKFDLPVDPLFMNLIIRCCDENPQNRPKFKEIFKELSSNIFLNDVDREKIKDYVNFITLK